MTRRRSHQWQAWSLRAWWLPVAVLTAFLGAALGPGRDGEAHAAQFPGPPIPPQDAPVVVLFDGGVDVTHHEIRDSLWLNPREVSYNGKDDDSNGIVDDMYGFNATHNTGDVSDGGDVTHGTAMAGLIVGAVHRSRWTRGIALGKARVMVVSDTIERVFELTAFARAIDYAIEQKKRGANIRVVNASFGGIYRDSDLQAICEAAINQALDADILIVLAAGSQGEDVDKVSWYPGQVRLPNVLNVTFLDGAGTALDRTASYGASTVDLAAEGESVLVVGMTHGADRMTGSSIAAAKVSGAAALLFARNPKLTAVEAARFILTNTEAMDSLKGRVVSGGKLNVEKLMAAATRAGW